MQVVEARTIPVGPFGSGTALTIVVTAKRRREILGTRQLDVVVLNSQREPVTESEFSAGTDQTAELINVA